MHSTVRNDLHKPSHLVCLRSLHYSHSILDHKPAHNIQLSTTLLPFVSRHQTRTRHSTIDNRHSSTSSLHLNLPTSTKPWPLDTTSTACAERAAILVSCVIQNSAMASGNALLAVGGFRQLPEIYAVTWIV
jgi:hypothetical protein